jgi:hypothetical protein
MATSGLSSSSLIQTISGSISACYPKGTRKPTLCDKRPVREFESNHVHASSGFYLRGKTDRGERKLFKYNLFCLFHKMFI